MAYHEPTFKGDKDYPIDTTGDCCIGDQVRFERAVFTGSYRKPKFSHFEIITGEIIKESYGEKTGQHTFTLCLKNGETIRIKGRNLYKNGIWRKDRDIKERNIFLEDKHKRGDLARSKKYAL